VELLIQKGKSEVQKGGRGPRRRRQGFGARGNEITG